MTGLLFALGAALCYGVGSVLQAAAARGTARSDSLDPGLLVRLASSRFYVVGVGLDVAGFVLTLVAARVLPLFVVQSILASFLAVAAILGRYFLGMLLRPLDRLGLALVLSGLFVWALSAAPERSVRVGTGLQWAMLGAVVLLLGVGIVLGRVHPWGAQALGSVAGLDFGLTSVGARMVPPGPGPSRPVARVVYVAGSACSLGHLPGRRTRPVGLQECSAAKVGDTGHRAPGRGRDGVRGLLHGCARGGVPALVGLGVLGDQSRAGWGWVAVVGLVLAVAGSLRLSRHGEAPEFASPQDMERTA